MKKITLLLTAAVLTVAMAACSKKTPAQPELDLTADTQGTKLAVEFKNQLSKTTDLNEIANNMANFTEITCMVENFEPGYFPGFDTEITGFKQAVGFLPMIGSIPFVSYIFEVENPAEFKELLKAAANPRWNICTEAAETVVISEGNYVFFTMCPGEEEDW